MASGTRLFVGRLGHNMLERDLHDLFSKFGRIVNCSMKTTYGFVEFENPRDARDAMHSMDGYKVDGSRIAVEFSRRRSDRDNYRERDREDRDRYRDRDRDRRRDDRGHGEYEGRSRGGSGRYSPPYNSKYRLTINNLPSGCTWQDLKDHFRQVGDVCFSDVRRSRGRDGTDVGVVEFKHHADMREAIRRFDGSRLRGETITIACDYVDGRRSERSGSRSPPPIRKRSRSRSATPGARDRPSSRSPPLARKRSERSGSRSPTPVRIRSGSRSPHPRVSRNSPPRSRSHSRSRSRSNASRSSPQLRPKSSPTVREPLKLSPTIRKSGSASPATRKSVSPPHAAQSRSPSPIPVVGNSPGSPAKSTDNGRSKSGSP